MKTIRLISIVILISTFAMPFHAKAQARKLTKRVVNPDNTAVRPNQPVPTPAPAPPAPPIPTQRPPQTVPTAAPEKTKEQKEETLRKTIEFQKKRAEAGAPSAQYDLGVRYLEGDGVKKNLELAQKWLNAAATNGNSQAIKKLEALKKISPTK